LTATAAFAAEVSSAAQARENFDSLCELAARNENCVSLRAPPLNAEVLYAFDIRDAEKQSCALA